MNSKLPDSEKQFQRVVEDVFTVAGAGFETTANALRLILFHVFNTPEILEKLRCELSSADFFRVQDFDLRTLEQLPYLTAIIMEGIRLSPALGTRMARIAPDRDLFYNNWRIPAGTPVGMTLILMHTDERSYQRAKEFIPDRWIDPIVRKEIEKSYAPFSKGTRSCLGM